MQLDDFFGLNLDLNHFQIDHVLDRVGLREAIAQLAVIRELAEDNGPEHPIVSVGKRQYTLKFLKPLLDTGMLPYDARFEGKEVTTGTDNDRRYAAEEKLLLFALIVASGKTPRQLRAANFKPDMATLRELKRRALYERFWDILADDTRVLVLNHRQRQVTEDKPSFWRRLFR